MEFNVTVAYLSTHLEEVLKRVKDCGDTYVIVGDEGNLAKLGPMPPLKSVTLADLARELAKIPWPDPEYFDELERIQATQQRVEPPEWPC